MLGPPRANCFLCLGVWPVSIERFLWGSLPYHWQVSAKRSFAICWTQRQVATSLQNGVYNMTGAPRFENAFCSTAETTYFPLKVSWLSRVSFEASQSVSSMAENFTRKFSVADYTELLNQASTTRSPQAAPSRPSPPAAPSSRGDLVLPISYTCSPSCFTQQLLAMLFHVQSSAPKATYQDHIPSSALTTFMLA